MNALLICVIYDGINQAVTESQIIIPLIKRAHHHNYNQVILISFEQHLTPTMQAYVQHLTKIYPHLTCRLYKRPPFINSFLLWQQAWQLERFLKVYRTPYTLIARGPFAGIIAKRGITKKCTELIVQARGLAVEEYDYTHKHKKNIKGLAYTMRLSQLHLLEKQAYAKPKKTPFLFTIESISTALTNHLTYTYQTKAQFVPAAFDTPQSLTKQEQTTYKTNKRAELAIPGDAIVYAYNGSLKLWQCPQETIELFKNRWDANKKSIFLALTPETTVMEILLKNNGIPSNAYRVISAPHTDIVPLLCAADFGILLREAHPLNWVSRPTKALEYTAAGLSIIHNNTVACLLPEPPKPVTLTF